MTQGKAGPGRWSNTSVEVLNDMTRTVASDLQARFLRQVLAAREEGNDEAEQYWSRRLLMCRQAQQRMDPYDRIGVVAQMDVWQAELAELVAPEAAAA